MKVGVKVGPEKNFSLLEKTKPECCEVWFRLDWQQKYQDLFKYLRKNKIPFGLHFWAMVEGKYFPNLLYLEKNIAKKTFVLIKKTIDKAAKEGAVYVNFHPESYRLSLLDLNNSCVKLVKENKKIDKKRSFEQLVFYLGKIKNYALKKGLKVFVETVPKYVASDFGNIEEGRKKIEKTEGLETEKFVELVKMGFDICFDIGHTIGQCVNKDKKRVADYLLKAAKKLKPGVGLIHLNTVLPPFNGTDSHNGVLEEDFKKGVLPNKVQLIELLKLFKDKDIWLIPEPPKEKMAANYSALKKIVNIL